MFLTDCKEIKHKTVVRMSNYGGSFARCIAEAWFVADNKNRQKLEEALTELFEKYEIQ